VVRGHSDGVLLDVLVEVAQREAGDGGDGLGGVLEGLEPLELGGLLDDLVELRRAMERVV
jgi:hypothetical protein